MRLIHKATGKTLLGQVTWCDTFLCRLRGLMFRAALAQGEGLLLVEGRESRLDTSIHMLFMRFPIAAIWLDGQYRVVDAVLAKPWRPMYAPRAAARYTLEAAPALLDQVAIGDELVLENA